MLKEPQNWYELLGFLKERLGIKRELSAVLFIIGLQEEGSGFRKYSQNEKTALIKKAEFELLKKENYYIKIDTEENGEDIWVENPNKDIPGEPEIDELLKELSLRYFKENIENFKRDEQ